MGDRADIQSTADYIFDMSTQLARLAAEVRLDMLAYLLDMVRLEAEAVCHRQGDRHGNCQQGSQPGLAQAVLRPERR